MHQITLLGGLGVAQHPDSAHFLRPDRVYRTGVLSPMTGYRPGEAVMAVSQDFTQGPYSGMSLQGLRGPGLFGKISAWWQGVKARAAAGRGALMPAAHEQVPTTAAQPVVSTTGPMPHGHAYGLYKGQNMAPMAAQAMQVGPLTRMLPQAMVTQAYGQSPSLPTYAADAAAKTTMMRWRGVRWPWG